MLRACVPRTNSRNPQGSPFAFFVNRTRDESGLTSAKSPRCRSVGEMEINLGTAGGNFFTSSLEPRWSGDCGTHPPVPLSSRKWWLRVAVVAVVVAMAVERKGRAGNRFRRPCGRHAPALDGATLRNKEYRGIGLLGGVGCLGLLGDLFPQGLLLRVGRGPGRGIGCRKISSFLSLQQQPEMRSLLDVLSWYSYTALVPPLLLSSRSGGNKTDLTAARRADGCKTLPVSSARPGDSYFFSGCPLFFL